jgi:hypothetical protein
LVSQSERFAIFTVFSSLGTNGDDRRLGLVRQSALVLLGSLLEHVYEPFRGHLVW